MPPRKIGLSMYTIQIDTPSQPRTSQPEVNAMKEVWVLGGVAAVRVVSRSEWLGKLADSRINKDLFATFIETTMNEV